MDKQQNKQIVVSAILAVIIGTGAWFVMEYIDIQIQIPSEAQAQEGISCSELDSFFNILDRQIDWTTVADSDYKAAQQAELDLVYDLNCEDYMAGSKFELWSFDN